VSKISDSCVAASDAPEALGLCCGELTLDDDRELPLRRSRQSLNGYVWENLERLEKEISVGVPYKALVDAALIAGFTKIAVPSLHSAMYRARKRRAKRARNTFSEALQRLRLEPTPVNAGARSAEEDDVAALGRRYHQLVRSPMPGSNETDLLV
jgi:hypothetical protein